MSVGQVVILDGRTRNIPGNAINSITGGKRSDQSIFQS